MAKEFTYKGRTLEELKSLTLQEFANLIPARVRRSLLRGFTDPQKRLMNKIKKSNQGIYKKQIKTHCRDLVILPEMVGLKINIHNGKSFMPVEIQPEMLGHFLGEFALTRQTIKHSAPGIGATRSSAFQSK